MWMPADAGLCQYGVVCGTERPEVLGCVFGGAVASVELAFKVDADFRDHRMPVLVLGGRYLYGGDEVLLAVGAQHPDGKLAAGEYDREYDRLLDVSEHEAQGGGGEGHGVRAVQDDEAVVAVVVLFNQSCEPFPELYVHVGGVDDRVK